LWQSNFLPHSLKFSILAQRFAVCQLAADAALPAWATAGSIFCVMRNPDELSILCEEQRVPPGLRMESGWSAIKLEGPFPFSMTGVLSSVVRPLAEAGISVFAVSTFDTDYVLVKQDRLDQAQMTLESAGHTLVSSKKS